MAKGDLSANARVLATYILNARSRVSWAIIYLETTKCDEREV